MSEVIQSADELFALLAGDDQQVPESLLRGKKSVTRKEQALVEQAKLERLNGVETWMKQDDALESDPAEFVSLGETIVGTLLKIKKYDLNLSLVQKLTKIGNLWLKVSKSCKLLESHLQPSHISTLVDQLLKSQSPSAGAQDICGRFLLAMIQCSPSRLFVDTQVIEAFNKLVRAWCKGSYRSNGFTLLNLLPIEFLAQLSWPFSEKTFTMSKTHDLIVRLLKKRLTPRLDQDLYVESLRQFKGQNKKELEELFIKLVGAIARSKSVPVTNCVREWVSEVSSRDTKQAGVSLKNTRLATDLLRQL